jgi:hypothetical protein
VHSSSGDYYSLGAVVRLDRALTRREKDRQAYGLIAGPAAERGRLEPGDALPDALFGGTGLGTIGKPSRHCYRAEVAQLRARRTVVPGARWRLALHDGARVLGAGRDVVLRRQTSATELAAARALGCL